MKKLALLLAAPVVIAGLALVSIAPANATNNTVECSVKAVGNKNTAGNADSRFKLNSDGTVSATFEVKGGKDCKQTVTLATWQAPDGDKGRPYELQKLFAHKTGTFGVGKHTLTVKLPNCFYQVDLVRGSNPTGPNGTPIYEAGRMMGSLHGGTKKCEEPKKPEVPKTPETPEAPETPAELPATGPEAAFVVAGLLATGAAGVQYVRQNRRNS